MCRTLFILFALSGCDFLQSATARVVVAGIVVRTPELKLNDQYAVPAETVATVWLGERENEASTKEPDPISGAAVSLDFGTAHVELAEQPERGLYLASSLEQPKLVFESTPYLFTAAIAGSEADYGGSVTAPTALSSAAENLTPSPTESVPGFPEVQRHPKSAALEVSWLEQFGKRGFVAVYRAQASDPASPELVFDTRPKSALQWIEFVAGDPPRSVSVPASVFSSDGVYAVVLVALERGNVLPSTFVGSPLLAGSGAVRFLAVGDVSL